MNISGLSITTEGFKLTVNDTLFFCRRLTTACLGFLLATEIGATEAYLARASIVSDGDTLWVEPEGGGTPRKLRLQGVDAPEICQPGGVAAREALRALVMQRRLKVQVKYFDDYGRGLAHIEVDGQDVGAALVRQGQAWSYRWRRSLGPYAAQEAQARQDRIGVFAQPTPELPRDFRRRNGSCYVPDGNGAFKLK
jgi:micrococcal nuclease